MTLEEEVLFIIEAHREAIKKATDVAEAEVEFEGVLLKLRLENSISGEAYGLISQLYGYNQNSAAAPKLNATKRAKSTLG